MAEIYYDKDADLDLLKDKKIAIIGFGSQGHAHALNLKDSGLDVVVGLYPESKSWSKVEESGLTVGTVDDVTKESDVIMVLAPDQVQRDLYEQHIAQGLESGNMLMFAHGFNVHYNQIAAPEASETCCCTMILNRVSKPGGLRRVGGRPWRVTIAPE